MPISETAIAWIVAGLSFAAYYAMFGRLSVQGYDSPGSDFH